MARPGTTIAASTWGTYLRTSEPRTSRTCFTNTAPSATSTSRIAAGDRPSPSLSSRTRGTRKTRCTGATATITMDTACGWSFPEAAVARAEAAAGAEAAALRGAATARRPGGRRTEWLSPDCLQVEAGRI